MVLSRASRPSPRDGRVLVEPVALGLPGAVRLLLVEEPAAGAVDQGGVDVVDAGHVLEFEQAVGGQDAVGRRVAEPVEPAAGDLEAQEPLVAEVDVLPRLGLDRGQGRVGALQVVEGEDVRVGRRRGLLEAAVGRWKTASSPSTSWLKLDG